MDAKEIASALRVCNNPKGRRCSNCPVFSKYEHRECKTKVDMLAAGLIDALAAENARLRAELQGSIESGQHIDSENLRLIKERDKAVEDLAQDAHCMLCKHHRSEGGDCIGMSMCAAQGRRVGWQWRGTEGKAFCCGYPGWSTGLPYADYGKTWLAYRTKPERSEAHV